MALSGHLHTLLDTLPQVGCVEWIGIRPARNVPMKALNSVQAHVGLGLLGDRFKGRETSPRQVTLIQHEHLAVIASCLGIAELNPQLLRRNISVSGINLLALKTKYFEIGAAVFEMTGACHPCSKMEKILGEGGYNALRGHGGITARVIVEGEICVGDSLKYLDPQGVLQL